MKEQTERRSRTVLKYYYRGRILIRMPAKRKITEPNDERFCPWRETKYHAKSDQTGPLCSDCRGELLEQPKEFLEIGRAHV